MNNQSWVIDGNYFSYFAGERFSQSDYIVFLNFNRFTCFFRALRRYFKYKGVSREIMTDGCDEKFDFEFIKWLLFDGRGKSRKKDFEKIISKYKEKTYILKNQAQLDKFMDNPFEPLYK